MCGESCFSHSTARLRSICIRSGSDPIHSLFPKTLRSFIWGSSVRHPLGCIDDPDAIVLPGRLVYPGDQQFGIGVADPQQRVNPEVFRAGKLLSVNADPHCFYASRWTMADFPAWAVPVIKYTFSNLTGFHPAFFRGSAPAVFDREKAKSG